MPLRSVALIFLIGSFALPRAGAHTVANFQLKDPRDQRTVALVDLKDKKAIVVVFLGADCVLCNSFLPVLAELHEKYKSKGVAFIGINSNSQDSLERVAVHARRRNIPFPMLKDAGNKVADQFAAERTPEAFVLDAAGKILYRGRIDDQFGIGYSRPGKPKRRDLAAALDEVLAGKPVSVAKTKVAGCHIGRVAKPKKDGPITYAKHISRILQNNCQECHRPGQVAPMSLLTYKSALAWSETIREVVSEGRMPPWYADPRYGKFRNDRRLSPQDRKTLLDWIDNGMPRGDDKDLPPPLRFPQDWNIGKPDIIVKMPRAFEVPALAPKNGVPYQYFTVDPGFQEDHWLQRAEIRPGQPAVVHHSVVFVVPKGEIFNPFAPSAVLCGNGPGEMPLRLPDGLAKKIPAGAWLVFQMHYTPNGKACHDVTSIGMIFSKTKPRHRVLTKAIYNAPFFMHIDKIPAGAANYKIESDFVFKRDAHLLHFMPHMHLRGKDFLYQAVYPGGKKEILLSVPRYNFNWQGIYRVADPLAMPKGSKIHCVAHFDNSADNPDNPDPKCDVYWGGQTWEEMMYGWVDYYIDEDTP